MAMLLLTGSRMDQPDLTGLGMESPERLISIYFNARGRYWYFSYEIDSLTPSGMLLARCAHIPTCMCNAATEVLLN